MIDIKRAVETVGSFVGAQYGFANEKIRKRTVEVAERTLEIENDPQERLEWTLIGIIAEHEYRSEWDRELPWAAHHYTIGIFRGDARWTSLGHKLAQAMRDAVEQCAYDCQCADSVTGDEFKEPAQEYPAKKNIMAACGMASRLITLHVDYGWDAVSVYAKEKLEQPVTGVECLAMRLMALIAEHESNDGWQSAIGFAANDIFDDPDHWIRNPEEEPYSLMHKIGFLLAKAAGICKDKAPRFIRDPDSIPGGTGRILDDGTVVDIGEYEDSEKPLFLPTQGYHPDFDEWPDIKADAERVADIMSRIPDDPAPADPYEKGHGALTMNPNHKNIALGGEIIDRRAKRQKRPRMYLDQDMQKNCFVLLAPQAMIDRKPENDSE